MSAGTDGDVVQDAQDAQDAPYVPLVEDPPLTRDGRPARATPAGGQVSPLRALAGAGIAVAGVALGIGALLTVTSGADDGPGPVVADDAGVLADGTPAQEPVEAAVAPTPVDVPSAAPVPAAAAPSAAAPSAAATSGPAPARAPAAAPRRTAVAARPPVTVLNNSTIPGLADRAAARFARAGWPVRQTGNFRGKLRATTVYYEPGQRAAARRFASTFRGVTRVLPRAANIPGPRGLVVVLTRDFSA